MIFLTYHPTLDDKDVIIGSVTHKSVFPTGQPVLFSLYSFKMNLLMISSKEMKGSSGRLGCGGHAWLDYSVPALH